MSHLFLRKNFQVLERLLVKVYHLLFLKDLRPHKLDTMETFFKEILYFSSPTKCHTHYYDMEKNLQCF